MIKLPEINENSSRKEKYLNALAIGDNSNLPTPESRTDEFLKYICENGVNGSMGLNKAIVCVIDDDGTTRSQDEYTGMTSWLNNQGIPMDFAIMSSAVGSDGKLTVAQLKELEAKGNGILSHGGTRLQDCKSEDEVRSKLRSAVNFYEDNGFSSGRDIYVYPNGLNGDYTLTAEQVKNVTGEFFKYGLSVNKSGYSQLNGNGVYNPVPLTDKLNLARMEVNSTKGLNEYKTRIDKCIQNKDLLILFTHSFQSQFMTGGGYEKFKEIIDYLKTQDVEFMTVNNAFKKIESTLDQKITNINEDIQKIKDKLGL